MATTHLTDQEAACLPLAELIRRVRAGEQIDVSDAQRDVVRLELAPLDNSMKATIARFKQWEAEHGQPLRMEPDFADDLEQIVQLRAPRDTSAWD